MLKEFTNLRQERGGFRRLFCDQEYDLYAWYTGPGGELFGFQLVYFEQDEQKALTWTKDEGYRHNTVDGWDSGRKNKTPLLVPDGVFAPRAMLGRIAPLLDEIDPTVRQMVVDRIHQYPMVTPL